MKQYAGSCSKQVTTLIAFRLTANGKKTSGSSSRIKAALEIAATLEGMSVSKSELDQEKKFINFQQWNI